MNEATVIAIGLMSAGIFIALGLIHLAEAVRAAIPREINLNQKPSRIYVEPGPAPEEETRA